VCWIAEKDPYNEKELTWKKKKKKKEKNAKKGFRVENTPSSNSWHAKPIKCRTLTLCSAEICIQWLQRTEFRLIHLPELMLFFLSNETGWYERYLFSLKLLSTLLFGSSYSVPMRIELFGPVIQESLALRLGRCPFRLDPNIIKNYDCIITVYLMSFLLKPICSFCLPPSKTSISNHLQITNTQHAHPFNPKKWNSCPLCYCWQPS
jgi:hypothetical protein